MRPAAVRCGLPTASGRRWRARPTLAGAACPGERWRTLLAGTEETFIMAKRGFETTAYCTALLYVYSVAPRERTPSVNS